MKENWLIFNFLFAFRFVAAMAAFGPFDPTITEESLAVAKGDAASLASYVAKRGAQHPVWKAFIADLVNKLAVFSKGDHATYIGLLAEDVAVGHFLDWIITRGGSCFCQHRPWDFSLLFKIFCKSHLPI